MVILTVLLCLFITAINGQILRFRETSTTE